MVYGQVARVTEDNEICCVDGDSLITWRGIIIDGIGACTSKDVSAAFERYGRFDESSIAGDYELLITFRRKCHFVNGLIVSGMQTRITKLHKAG
jgi:hypothetical protein